jgi:stage II sporulation protein D
MASLVALLILILCPTLVLGATNVKVGLLWTLAGENYLGFDVLQGAYSLEVDGNVVRSRVTPGTSYRVGNGPWGMALFEDANPLSYATKLRLIPVQGKLPVFTLYCSSGKKSYRGSLEITYQDGKLLVSNTLGEQEYLYGVVPVEMSNSWSKQGIEALKAQAVAARTYLRAHYDTALTKGYNITDSPNIDQAYAGYGTEGSASKAVDATIGEILVDKTSHTPINTSYHSHSGGYTEDSENVWGGVDPHLRGKPDPFSLNQGFLADRWEFIASATALGRALNLGPVMEVKLEKYASGRVKNVIAKDISGKTVTKSGSKFAGLFYPRNRGITSNDFLGSFFTYEMIQPAKSKLGTPGISERLLPGKNKAVGPRLNRIYSSATPPTAVANPYPVYIFNGSGWGHGVGMSQWGAYGMAKQGYSYREILNYYYSNVQIEQKE